IRQIGDQKNDSVPPSRLTRSRHFAEVPSYACARDTALNEAAKGAADASRGHKPQRFVGGENVDIVGHKGGPCDPSTKNDAGGTPASEFIRAYRGVLSARSRGVCPVPSSSSRSVRAGGNPPVSGAFVHRPKTRRQHCLSTPFGTSLLLHQDPEAPLDRRGDALSEAGDSIARCPEP